ncbi:MAG: hypothetical protein CVV41_11400 [Candidatus Riflebacteria bacterium HGW-Riflebacteria-1]|jgi:hypothetical protein|nr:MAG: hypothetical protein CVV41_11400 [Candidatus Riflebacteria bacterium HGW-Riflebacteria-1]
MKKLAFFALIMTVAMVLPAYAGAGCGAASCGSAADSQVKSNSALSLDLALQGFAFQGKEFKTVMLNIKKEDAGKESANAPDKDSGATAGKEDGRIALDGFAYTLKVVSSEGAKLALDLFRTSDFAQPKDAGQDKLRLPVPVGHMSISRNQPNAGSIVYLGSLRLNDEETKVEGEFDLYLNIIAPPDSAGKK